MFNFTDSKNIGKEYKDFVLLKIDELKDLKSKGVFLRHKITGLEVYHVINDDKENLFAFAFRTLSKDNFGTAHIMEHSTLCGSEKYPLKEPFTTLESQSLNTFLNAMTYPDKTVYPAASLIHSDYFNIMDVYADAVFFPKLDYNTFLQEGHRLEVDEKGNFSIQGVVYNEMKGNYTSFFPIAYSNLIKAMFPDSYPAFDSGGDPQFIPELSYQTFLDFHQKFYNPDNCLLFLYGNIPTYEQIDYISEHFIDRIKTKYNFSRVMNNYDCKTPLVKESVHKLQKLNFQTKSTLVKDISCQEGSTGSMVVRNWYSGSFNLEKLFLGEAICGNDSSPISKVLRESGLGDDIATGNFGQFKEEFISLGLTGVQKGDEKKVFALVEQTVKNIYENGIPQKDIDSAIMGIDYNLRDVNRYNGPFSLKILENVLKSWNFGLDCAARLNPISEFEKIKALVKSDKNYFQKLMEKYFIKNPVWVDFICEPSSSCLKKRKENEAKLIETLSKNIDVNKLKEKTKVLHKEQQRKETEEELSCIPHTKLSELDKQIPFTTAKLEFLKGADKNDIPFFTCNVKSNGIFYITVLFPYDNLNPKDFPHMSFLSDVMTSLGWDNKPWDECIAEAACIMGDNYGALIGGESVKSELSQAEIQKYKDYNFTDRFWLTLNCKALTSHAKETLELFSTIITKMDFKDPKRFETLLQEELSEIKSSFISDGRGTIIRLAKAFESYNSTIKEIIFGISRLNTLQKYKKQNTKKILQNYQRIYNECRSNGAVICLACDEESLKQIKPLMQDFAQKAELTKLKPARKREISELYPYIYNAKDLIKKDIQHNIKTKSQTAYACVALPSAPAYTKEAAAQTILCNWMNSHVLWDKLRTSGGAYGAGCGYDSVNNLIFMATYRDPNPEKSVQVFLQILDELSNNDFTEEEIEKTIVSRYGEIICPVSPKAEASESIEAILYGFSKEIFEKRVEDLLSVTVEDIKKAAKEMALAKEKLCKKVLFCDKKMKTSGKNLKIPL